ncbi:MAG: DUF4249 domain-containing protein [Nonlabens sp.]|nr:DUF4249 domain-containing protein [Nonlabens sp.]
MKKILYLSFLLMALQGCQDVIELDLNNADPRLVIDAYIELNEDGTTTTQVKLTRSASFYQEEPTIVTDALVTITSEDGTIYNLTNNNNAIYTTDLINVQESTDYTLEIIDEGFTYRATQQLVSTVPIIDVQQEEIEGLGDLTKITAFYNDPSGFGDFYLFSYKDVDNFQTDIGDDEFFDGNRAPTIFFIDELEPMTASVITIKGIDQNTFKFYEKLLQQAGEGGPGGGPFGTPPATVRGNVINTTDASRFPFGYFRISQVFEVDYISQ